MDDDVEPVHAEPAWQVRLVFTGLDPEAPNWFEPGGRDPPSLQRDAF